VVALPSLESHDCADFRLLQQGFGTAEMGCKHFAKEQSQKAHVRFGVKSGHWDTAVKCPLYPRKRTLVERLGMSVMCQKRTFERVSAGKKCAPVLIGNKLDWRTIKCLQLRALKDRINRTLIKALAFTQQIGAVRCS